MWEYDHGVLPLCFGNYLKRVSEIHDHNTRSKSQNKLSQNTLVNTDLHVFNSIAELDFYKKCKSKQLFKNKIKDYLIVNDCCWW